MNLFYGTFYNHYRFNILTHIDELDIFKNRLLFIVNDHFQYAFINFQPLCELSTESILRGPFATEFCGDSGVLSTSKQKLCYAVIVWAIITWYAFSSYPIKIC